ncbi:hypothetical protein [Frankia sp. Cppng1_Ct_nod]|nr:hypothetical protein [Frankia sp. Cppng1_Ct_nod]
MRRAASELLLRLAGDDFEFAEATCLVHDGWYAEVDAVGSLLLTRA